MYTGKQANCSSGTLTYDVESDIFKPYGFDKCTKWTTGTSATADTKFLAYSHIFLIVQ